MTVKEVAALLNLSPSTIYRMVEAGTLPATRLGKQLRFSAKEIESLARVEGTTLSPPSSHNLSADTILELSKQVLDSWKFDAHWASNSTVAERLATALGDLIDGLQEHGVAQVDAAFAELERSALHSGPNDRGDDTARVRAQAGPLARLLTDQDPYPISQRYVFSTWTEPEPLSITILGPSEDESASETATRSSLVVAHERLQSAIDALEQAPDSQRKLLLKDQVSQLLEYATFAPRLRDDSRRAAAAIALESSAYTRRLMSPALIDELSPTDLARFNLPHTDQRSITFFPASIATSPIGGAALLTHTPLLVADQALIGLLVQLLLYRARTADDIAMASVFAEEHARWYAAGILQRRIRHDVQKPIEAIHGRIKTVLSKTSSLSEEVVDLLRGIDVQLALLNDTMRAMRVSSIDEMKIAAHESAEIVPLADTIQEARWVWGHEARNRAIAVTTDPAVDSREDTASYPPVLVSEILSNLVSNAVKFARRRITISARIKPGKPRTIEFEVRDDGPGLPQEVLEQFTDGAKPILRTEPHSASGIGLYLSSFIARHLLGGSIECQNEGGARVKLSFPEFSN